MQHVYNQFPNAIRHPWWEQRAIRDCLLQNCLEASAHVHVIHSSLINAYRPTINGSALSVHYAGVRWGSEMAVKMDAIFVDFVRELAPQSTPASAAVHRTVKGVAEGMSSLGLAAGMCAFEPQGPLQYVLQHVEVRGGYTHTYMHTCTRAEA